MILKPKTMPGNRIKRSLTSIMQVREAAHGREE